MKKYRETHAMSKEEIEYRDRIVDELRHRTGATIVQMAAYKVLQELSPNTVRENQIVLELRVGNHLSSMIFSEHEAGYAPNTLFYGMRQLGNRMVDSLIKAGAQTL